MSKTLNEKIWNVVSTSKFVYQASKVAKEALEKSAIDHSNDEALFREDLLNIARTTLSSKILSQHKDFFSNLAVDAVMRLKGSGSLDAIQIIKIQGGSLDESFLDAGKLCNLLCMVMNDEHKFLISEGKIFTQATWHNLILFLYISFQNNIFTDGMCTSTFHKYLFSS